MTPLSLVGIAGWLILASYPVTHLAAIVLGVPLIAAGAVGTWAEWRGAAQVRSARKRPAISRRRRRGVVSGGRAT